LLIGSSFQDMLLGHYIQPLIWMVEVLSNKEKGSQFKPEMISNTSLTGSLNKYMNGFGQFLLFRQNNKWCNLKLVLHHSWYYCIMLYLEGMDDAILTKLTSICWTNCPISALKNHSGVFPIQRREAGQTFEDFKGVVHFEINFWF